MSLFMNRKKLLWIHIISCNGYGYRNEQGPCALVFLDNSSCQLKLSKLIKYFSPQQHRYEVVKALITKLVL